MNNIIVSVDQQNVIVRAIAERTIITETEVVTPFEVVIAQPIIIEVAQGVPGRPGGDTFSWIFLSEIEGVTYQCLSNKGYWYNGLSLGLFELPELPARGDRLIVQRIGAANWRLTQRAGEQIQVFNQASTLGITGSVASVDEGSSIEIVFDGDTWNAISSSGNLEVI